MTMGRVRPSCGEERQGRTVLFTVRNRCTCLFLICFTVLLGSPSSLAFLIPPPATTLTPSPPRHHPLHRRPSSRLQSRPNINDDSLTSNTTATTSAEEGIGVGIDLGTTHSAVAILVDGIPTIVPIPDNGRTVPSVVAWDADLHDYLVGNPAIQHEARNHPLGLSYRNVKRILGTGNTMARDAAPLVPHLVLSDCPPTRRNNKNKRLLSLSKQIEDATAHPALLHGPPSSLSDGSQTRIEPELISSRIVRALLDAVRRHAGQNVTRAVVGVPAYFDDAQRDATVRACRLAGVPKVKLLREPEAAALAYGVGKKQIGNSIPNGNDDDELVLVFDLGGGTFDVSVLLVGGGLTQVISTSGNVRLGGSDFDARIAEHLARIVRSHADDDESQENISLGGEAANNNAMAMLIRVAEAVRIHLSNNRKAYLALPLHEEAWSALAHARDVIVPKFDDNDDNDNFLQEGVSNSTHVLYQLDRKTMEGLCRKELQALLRPLREVAIMAGALLPGDARPGVVEAAFEMEEEYERAMREAKGGAPIVFEDFYKENQGERERGGTMDDPNMLLQLQELDMKERKRAQQKGRKRARNVAKRERKFRQEKRKLDTVAETKVIDGISGRPISQVVLVGGATRMPVIGRLLAAMTGVVPQRTVNPDEAVALGCAVHVGVLDGDEALDGLTVLTPMQAAIMRAVAEKNGLLNADDEDDFREADFETIEFF